MLINVYGQNNNDPDFYAKLLGELQEPNSDHNLIVGDLNGWLDPSKDKKGGRSVNNASCVAEVINSFLEQSEWLDVWRSRNEHFAFTRKQYRLLILTRIDYVLAPICMASMINRLDILPATFSDHCPFSIELFLDNSTRGRGTWKFNTNYI